MATSALAFNGVTIGEASDALYEMTMGVAERRIGKQEVVAELSRIARIER
jgi:hypothetical protein